MIRGILFDKDGTLVEFSENWEQGTLDFLKNGFKLDEQASHRTLQQIGFIDGHLVPNSPIASGTSIDIAEIISVENGLNHSEILEQLREHYFKWAVDHPEAVRPLADLATLFKRLKKAGIKIGIATADDHDVTEWTFKYLGIDQYIDFMGTSEHFTAKPHQEMLEAFCMSTGLTADEVIHVGDSVADMNFSKHCHSGVAVLSGAGTREELERYSEYVIGSVNDLIPLLQDQFDLNQIE